MFGHNKQLAHWHNSLAFLLLARLKGERRNKATAGFTLIELLVAMIIAVLVISPLLGLAINLLQTDRQEQAKATSEEELQLAADFIARDLQQAVFIYDADALDAANPVNIRNQIPPVAGVDGCNNINDCTPILVFWKRRRIADAVPFNAQTAAIPSGQVDCTDNANANSCNDAFVYSLVGYYLIENNGVDNNWSNTARIGRFEITDGVRYPDGKYIAANLSRRLRNSGFAMFDLTLNDPTVEDKLNRWVKGGEDYAVPTPDTSAASMQILVDYIDQTAGNVAGVPPRETCPSFTVGTPPVELWTQSPKTPTADLPTSFSACINTTNNTAKFYIRGNALARIRSRNDPPEYTEESGRAGYFSNTNTQAQGIGRLIQ